MAETKTKPAAKKTTASQAKPAVKKAATTVATTKKAAPKARAKKAEKVVSSQERYEMIQRIAYFIAEHNGFVGDPLAFWSEAEAQVNNTKS